VVNFVKVYKRTCLVALIKYSCGSYSYILTPYGVDVGMYVKTVFKPVEFTLKYQLGYLVLLKYLNPHTILFNLEYKVGDGGKYALAGGVSALVLVTDEFTNQVLIQLPTEHKI
jgi:ribosomal protein L2